MLLLIMLRDVLNFTVEAPLAGKFYGSKLKIYLA